MNPPPLINKLFRYRKFSETQIRRVPPRNFSALWDKKNFDTKSWHNSLKHKIFRYPKLVTHWRVPLRNFLALWDKKFQRKIFILPPPLLSINFFETSNFLKQRRVPLRSFSALWDNKLSIENRDIPLLGIKFFDTGNFLKHIRVPRQNFSALWDENFRRKILILPPPSYP